MALNLSRLFRPALLVFAVVITLGCGATTTVVVNGPTATAVPATATPHATATPAPPTATPTPGHLLVNIRPNPPGYYGGQNGGTSEYTCHSGTTCPVDGPCTSPDWPTFFLNNIGQTALNWSATVQGTPGGWGLSATQGTLAGGAATSVSMYNGPGGGGATYVFSGPGQTVTVTASCGAG